MIAGRVARLLRQAADRLDCSEPSTRPTGAALRAAAAPADAAAVDEFTGHRRRRAMRAHPSAHPRQGEAAP